MKNRLIIVLVLNAIGICLLLAVPRSVYDRLSEGVTFGAGILVTLLCPGSWVWLGLSALSAMALAAPPDRSRSHVQREVSTSPGESQGQGRRREPIPDSVKMYVWQRDGGRCVRCGSNERLEYDHIIPLSMGGSNTARNIQLLCEKCNRSKGGDLA